MKKAIKDIIDKTWGTGKCDIPSVLNIINSQSYQFTKDDLLDVFYALFNKQGLSSTPNELASLIFRIAEIYQPKSVIDICCGTGNILYSFKRQARKGVDINGSVIEIAKKVLPDCQFLVADSLQHDFGEERFDRRHNTRPRLNRLLFVSRL